MSKSIYRMAADGMPARVSGGWAQTKLEAVSNYLTIFNRATHLKWSRRCFIDVLAGSGKCVLKRSTFEFDGSPLVALACAPPFTSLVFVESDERLFKALNARTSADHKRTYLINGDCNDPSVIAAIRGAVPRSALSIAFVDNLGLDVTFAALKELTAARRIDLIVTFQISDIKRQSAAAAGKPITSSYDKEDLKISAGGDAAVASYRFVVRIQADGIDVNRRYRTTNVWMKRQGRWQIVAAHTGFVLSPKQAASLAGEAS